MTGLATLLLVEDNPDDEMILLRALRKQPLACNIAVTRSGEDALDYLFGEGAHAGRAAPVLPALVLLDLQLPRMDGFEVLHRIRRHPRTRVQPVVVLTSSAEPEDIVRCYEAGANSYIRKPVDFARYEDMTRVLGLYWLTINEFVGRPPP
jgi:two-component system response regulator